MRSWPCLLLLVSCSKKSSAPEDASLPPPEGRKAQELSASFEDATESSGIAFRHRNGSFGLKRLPETMGSGACLFHYDGDGHLDLFLVNSTRWSDHPPDLPGGEPGKCALYRGLGNGRFEDVSERAGAAIETYGMGCAAADYDGDGDEDLYVTTVGDDLLLRNDQGRFIDVARQAGLGHSRWTDANGDAHPEWTTAALWFDADEDADLDLFVGGYCQWTPEIEIFTTINGVDKAFTTPDHYTGLPCRLYLNQGDGTFQETPLAQGDHLGKALGASLWDFNEDGRLDVVVANDTRPNFLFKSVGPGRFTEEGVALGLAYDENGRARAGMGVDVAHLDPWGSVVGIGNFAGEQLSLYRHTQAGSFLPTAAQAGLALPTRLPLAFGLAFLDLDLDGWLDLVIANGHIEPDINRFLPDQRHAQSAQLFRGGPDGVFEDASELAGGDFTHPRVGRGLASGDVDGDGDIDLLITQNGGSAVLLKNLLQERERSHYLRIDLKGPRNNPRAIGARVEVEAGGRMRRGTVRTGSSYLSQGETTLTFGLGTVDSVEHLTVRWPGGKVQSFPVPGIDRTLVLSADP